MYLEEEVISSAAACDALIQWGVGTLLLSTALYQLIMADAENWDCVTYTAWSHVGCLFAGRTCWHTTPTN